MSYTPVIPLSGYSGWQFIQNTYDRQFETFSNSAEISRNIDYFRENIRSATEVGDLIQDRKLLTVALGSVGLQEDLNKPAWVRKVMEEGTLSDDAFANRLGTSQYKELAETFSYGNGGFDPTDKQIERIIENYRTRAFEEAVGTVDNDMRLALNFQREIGAIADADLSERGGWLKITASKPLREVVEAAFGLPAEFSQIDLDRQLEVFADKANQLFGEKGVEVFKDPEVVDDMIRRFQVRRQVEAGPDPLTPGYGALQLLQSNQTGLSGAGIANLLLSNTL